MEQREGAGQFARERTKLALGLAGLHRKRCNKGSEIFYQEAKFYGCCPKRCPVRISSPSLPARLEKPSVTGPLR